MPKFCLAKVPLRTYVFATAANVAAVPDVANVAVYAAGAAGVTTGCEAAPPSDQAEKTQV